MLVNSSSSITILRSWPGRTFRAVLCGSSLESLLCLYSWPLQSSPLWRIRRKVSKTKWCWFRFFVITHVTCVEYIRNTQTQWRQFISSLVHSNLYLHGGINLNSSDALHNFHRTKLSHLGISTYATRSITLLWILISRCSQVLVPSPQGDLRVVMRRNLVGIRTGPDTLTLLLRARRLISEQTISLNFLSPENPTLLHSLNVCGSQSNTNAVHLLVDNFILLHWYSKGL